MSAPGEVLQMEAAELADLEQVKSEFLNLASHELRGPVTVLGGYIAMMRDGSLGEIPPRLAPILPTLAAKVEEMMSLIDRMLETARLREDTPHLFTAPLDLRDVVRGTVERLRPRLPATHQVRLTLPRSAVPVDGDASRLSAALTHLLDNAIRFSPAPGRVDARCAVRVEKGQAVVEVEDHGLGIAPEHLSRLFHIFGRIVTPDNSHIPGTGLGLYLANRVAEMHGGRITVASQPGEGSTFTLVLPLLS